ncbi:MAG: peptide MFS transporter [Marinifilaceae bacterium]
MLKGHPKGLLVAFFANMGERFGFYTMMSILVLFLQAKYGLTGAKAGFIYSNFYMSIYLLSVIGGIMADRFIGMGKTITMGIIMMAAGYVLIAIPGLGLIPVCGGLFVIALGNGLFKGNLQAVVGNLYEPKQYAHLRDSAFSLFYMGINVGALFAPTAAVKIRDYMLGEHGFNYNGDLPAKCHRFIEGTNADTDTFQTLANEASKNTDMVVNLKEFAQSYIDAFSTGYNYAFGFAAVMMGISLFVYFAFNKHLKPGFSIPVATSETGEELPDMPKAEIKERLIALGLVFLVCIFFWMSFHQNGLTINFFARDYIAQTAAPSTFFWFDVTVLLPMLGTAVGTFMMFNKKNNSKQKMIGAAVAVGMGILSYIQYTGLAESNNISPETFQHLNPFFIIALTPIVMAIFAALAKRKLEPSTPKKIGFGMLITTLGFGLLLVASLGLSSQSDLGMTGAPTDMRITPYTLVGVYFILTIAELFISPMGLSFVSKVAPPKMKGTMQAGWLCATAGGNGLLFIGGILYDSSELWMLWGFFIVCCLISAAFIFGILKKLERVTSGS